MTNRAELRRNPSATDAWNRPDLVPFDQMTSLGTVACHVHFKSKTDPGAILFVNDSKTARVDTMVGVFPRGLDIRTEDRLGDVKDRRGNVLFKGPLVVQQPIRRRGHLEARLEGHSGN